MAPIHILQKTWEAGKEVQVVEDLTVDRRCWAATTLTCVSPHPHATVATELKEVVAIATPELSTHGREPCLQECPSPVTIFP